LDRRHRYQNAGRSGGCAVDGISCTVEPGETVAVPKRLRQISERTVDPGFIPNAPLRITRGEIRFAGRDIMQLPDAAMREIRGGDIGTVFQEPVFQEPMSLNHVLTVGRQFAERRIAWPVRHLRCTAAEAVSASALERHAPAHHNGAGVRSNADHRRRADVTVQAQIPELMDLTRRLNVSLIIITHNLGVSGATPIGRAIAAIRPSHHQADGFQRRRLGWRARGQGPWPSLTPHGI
jgi:peptide/nickel transport system ATP-binding protein